MLQRVESVSGRSMKSEASAAEQFLEFVGSLVVDLSPFRAKNRILTLSEGSYRTLAEAAREVAKSAKRYGFVQLAARANTMAQLFEEAMAGFTDEQQRFLCVQSFQNFLAEAKLTIGRGADGCQVDKPQASVAENGRYRVLVVDDESIEGDFVARSLGGDYDVYLAETASQAIKLAQSKRPHLILLDVHLAEVNGFELLRYLKSLPECRDIPVLMRSNSYDDDTVVNGLVGGALDFLSKAMTRETLRQRTIEVLRTGRSRLYCT